MTFIPQNIGPQDQRILQEKTALPFRTGTPTITPNYEGYAEVAKIGSSYFLYVYIDGAFKRVQLT